MTTIVYRGGTLASDTGMTISGAQFCHTTKIARNSGGDLAGGCGGASLCASFLKWFLGGENGAAPEITRDGDHDTAKFILVRASGDITIYESGGSFPVRAPYYALGSGRSEALGALYMGATADDAVRAGIALDEDTFGEIISLNHQDA